MGHSHYSFKTQKVSSSSFFILSSVNIDLKFMTRCFYFIEEIYELNFVYLFTVSIPLFSTTLLGILLSVRWLGSAIAKQREVAQSRAFRWSDIHKCW